MTLSKKFSFSKNILLVFIGIELIFISAIFINIRNIKYTQVTMKRLVEVRIPTSLATYNIISEINQSLAALRGWVILGSEKTKKEREESWRAIEESLTGLDSYSKAWTSPANVGNLESVKKSLELFKIIQRNIETIAHTKENFPANKVLSNEAVPLAKIMIENITKMIDREKKLSASKKRKEIFGVMADIRGAQAVSFSLIRPIC